MADKLRKLEASPSLVSFHKPQGIGGGGRLIYHGKSRLQYSYVIRMIASYHHYFCSPSNFMQVFTCIWIQATFLHLGNCISQRNTLSDFKLGVSVSVKSSQELLNQAKNLLMKLRARYRYQHWHLNTTETSSRSPQTWFRDDDFKMVHKI